jgi:hypothetical protein
MVETVVLALGLLMLVVFVALILLWAFTEEIPRLQRTPYYRRLDEGPWGVRLTAVGRRQMRTTRLVNEVIGGDLGAAKHLVEHIPSVVVEGISESLAQELVAAFIETGAEAEPFRRASMPGTQKVEGILVDEVPKQEAK